MPARWQLARYFLWLGATGFGGPIALLGYMERDLVGRRGWFTADEFRRGVVFAQLAPGPLAAQLAMYCGWLRGGTAGATLAGLAFIAPSLAMVIGLAILYQAFEGLAWLRAAFAGVSAAVIAVVVRGAIRLARLTVQRDPLTWFVFAANAVVTVLIRAESIALLVASGVLTLLVREPHVLRGIFARTRFPAVYAAGLLIAAPPTHLHIFGYFCKAGAVVFGSGLAIVPFLYATVEQYGWLTEQQFLDAIAVSLITPGPVVITVAFIGHLILGLPGALLAAAGVFAPVYLATILGAPFFHRAAERPAVASLVRGLAAAAAGALAGAAVILSERALTSWLSVMLAVLSIALLSIFRKLPEPAVILAAALVGVLVS